MSFPSWLNVFRSRTEPRRSRRSRRLAESRRRAQRRLLVEGLEDRRLLTFVPAVDYPAGDNPQAIVSADFNNDDVLDLAVANYSSSKVSVLLGNANGTFQPAQTSATGANPVSLAVGDFNDDGILDLATANYLNSDVSVLLGIEGQPDKGTGTFSGPTNIGIGSGPSSVAVGDFNGDGLLDLGVTSNHYHPGLYDPNTGIFYYGYNEGIASVLVGDNQGNFSAPNSTSLPYSYLTSAIAANLDGPGADELVAVNSYYPYYYYGDVLVLIGNGSGSLELSTLLYTGTEAVDVAAADVNGDNAPDLVTANGNYSSVSVLLGDGLGGYGAAQTFAAGSYPSSVALGDFTGDGNVDIVAVDYYAGVNVLYGAGDGAFSVAVPLPAGLNPWSLASGDFDGDGWLDIAVASSNAGTASVLLNDQSWPGPPPGLSINDVQVTEGDAGTVAAVFTVTRSGNLDAATTVNFSTNGGTLAGSDYVANSGTLTFESGEATQTITILVNGDGTDEYDEVFYVNLSGATGANVVDSQGVGTIVDDDLPPDIWISDQLRKEGSRLNTAFAFTVSLSEPSGKGLYVSFATEDGTATEAGGDYFANSSYVYIGPGQTTGTLTVTVRADKTQESNETFAVKLTAATDGAGGTGGTIVDDEGIGTIVNDDRGSGKGGGKGNSNKVASAGLIAALLAEDELTTARKRK